MIHLIKIIIFLKFNKVITSEVLVAVELVVEKARLNRYVERYTQ